MTQPSNEALVERVALVLAPHLRLPCGPSPDCETQWQNADEAKRIARLVIAALAGEASGSDQARTGA